MLTKDDEGGRGRVRQLLTIVDKGGGNQMKTPEFG